MANRPNRLIDWTGERCVPWTDDIQVIYEHYHRYSFASEFVAGLKVLDLASGEGYGSSILSMRAQAVLGLDIDEDAVRHATENYQSDSLHFQVGDMRDLGNLGRTFDAVVCFEALEHVNEHSSVLDGITKVLAEDGILVISMPDRDVYTVQQGQNNPYHEHELTRPEFAELLGGWFSNVRILGQSVVTGSVIFPEPNDGEWAEGKILGIARDGDAWTPVPPPPPTYLVAVASNGKLPPIEAPNTMLDAKHEIVARAQRIPDPALIRDRLRLEHLCDDLLQDRRRTATSLDLITRRHDRLAEKLAAFGQATVQMEADLARSRSELEAARAARSAALADAEAIRNSTFYRVASSYRARVERLMPTGTLRRRVYTRLARRGIPPVTPVATSTSVVAPVRPFLEFPGREGDPDVSVIIPVHNGWHLTGACLASIRADVSATHYEIIVVDDCSTDETSLRLAEVRGIRVIRLDRNQGFVHAVNAGIRAAAGRYIVLLNNDTQVQIGWLDALVDVVEKDPSVGLVGSKLIYPDGSLQEAGGIIFDDGSGANYGRGADPSRPIFDFPRQVDYCSGASVLVRRSLLDKLGGLDTRFAPAYYEDTDLAFSVRRLGFKVCYEPKSHVVHFEGATNGVDLAKGVKQYQEVNRHRFVEKWAHDLSQQAPPGSIRLGSWRGTQARVFVADSQIPRPNEDSGSCRMNAILKLLSTRGYRVTFHPFNGSLQEPYASHLRDLGIEILDRESDVGDFFRSVNEELELAILSRPEIIWPLLPLLRSSSPRTKIIYDTVDLHFVRERRRAEIENSPEVAAKAEHLRQMELTLAQAADLTVVVTEVERQILLKELPELSVEVIPNVHEDEHVGLPFELRHGLLFVGSFPHPPNRDAAHYLVEEILPLVWRHLPEVECILVGSYPTDDIRALAGNRVRVAGWVPNLTSLYETTRLTVAPLRYGAGMKGKIGESLSHGVPVVTTAVGGEGMNLQVGKEILVGDSPESIAKSIVDAYTSRVLWEDLSVNGRRAIAGAYSPFAVGQILDDILLRLSKAPA